MATVPSSWGRPESETILWREAERTVTFQDLQFQVLPWSLSCPLSALLCSVDYFSIPSGPFPHIT